MKFFPKADTLSILKFEGRSVCDSRSGEELFVYVVEMVSCGASGPQMRKPAVRLSVLVLTGTKIGVVIFYT